MTSFSDIIIRTLNGPIDWETDYRKHERGQHRDFHGRPYRRGKNRCGYCGATLPANETLDPPPYRTNREALRQNLEGRNRLISMFMRKVGATEGHGCN